jgi:hypothetical protein
MCPTVSNPNCPSCQRLVQNKNFQRCVWCGHTLPADLLLNAKQISEAGERKPIASKEKAASSVQSKGAIASGAADVTDVLDAIGLALDLSDLF